MSRSNSGAVDRSTIPGRSGPDFLQLDMRDAPVRGMSDWLADRLRDAIADGRLPAGSRLPASRVLAGELHVSRGVVTDAYRRLSEDGRVEGRRRNGTVVLAPAFQPRPPVLPALPHRKHRAGGQTAPGGLFDAASTGAGVLDTLRAVPARTDLSPGVPDLAAFPRTAWLRAERAVLRDLSAAALGYGDPRGTPALRRAVADWLARNRGIRAAPDEVLVVSGTAQGLVLISQVLRDDGIGEVAVEEPGSLGARQQLLSCGLATPPVPVDGEGLHVGALGELKASAVLLTPAHQFPYGMVLSGARRHELMRWAAGGGLVIEDDYDAEHRYDRPPVPALRSLLADRVFYTGSVSKLLAPALRLGWVLAPPRYRDALVEAKRIADLGSAALPQLALARLMETGAMERHLRHVRSRHRHRRDVMTGALETFLPGATVHGAAAGLHLTVTFGAGGGDRATGSLADTDLAAAAFARGVKVHPLSWHCQSAHRPGLVLGYASNTPTAIAEGVAAVGAALGTPGSAARTSAPGQQ